MLVKNYALPGFVLSTLLLIFSCKNGSSNTDHTPELLRLNARYDSALLRKDTALLRSLFADDFILTNPEGRVLNRDEQLLNVATTELNWQSAQSKNVRISFYGNTAVLTGEFEGVATYRGNPLTMQERYTSVWVNMESGWKLVAEQANILR